MHQPQRGPDRSSEARRIEEQRQLELRRQQERARAEAAAALEREIDAAADEVGFIMRQELTGAGYLPPPPPPLIAQRAFGRIVERLQALELPQSMSAALERQRAALAAEGEAATAFVEQLRHNVPPPDGLLAREDAIGAALNRASISLDMPIVSATLRPNLLEIEAFLAAEWSAEPHRSVIAIHVDAGREVTVIQIGMARHGPIYITIPGVLKPEDIARKRLARLLGALDPFRGEADPLAVIDGAFQKINFTDVFRTSRVMRAPSGDVGRLAANIDVTGGRSRLSPENTVIVSSAPRTVDQYRAMFPNDASATYWGAWRQEADRWSGVVSATGFAEREEASRTALLQALTTAENVVVLVAHCDGKNLFMPDPPPGTVISAEFLLAHREAIAANKPFVYLLACEGGDLSNMQSFAETLLECGAAGVAAPQTALGAAEGRRLLGRILDRRRGSPPVEDLWRAMRDVDFYEVEVFLA